MVKFRDTGIVFAALAAIYITASIFMSACWFTNLGEYDGPRFGLLAVEVHSAVIEEMAEYPAGSGLIGGRVRGGYTVAYERGEFESGDKATTLCLMNPFSRYSDDIVLRLDFKHA